jgi:membrane fusion protein, copper/silver efflux system
VVVSSQFLIDSEASLRGVEARLNDEPKPMAERHRGTGRIEAIERDGITLTHGPIPSLKWGEMTMEFKAPAPGVPRGMATGDRVDFEFTMGADGPQITRLTLLPVLPGSPGPGATR